MKNTFDKEMKELLSKEECRESKTFLVMIKLAEKYGGGYSCAYQGDMTELCTLICNVLFQSMESILNENSYTDEEVEELVDDFEQTYKSAIEAGAYFLKMGFIGDVRKEQ